MGYSLQVRRGPVVPMTKIQTVNGMISTSDMGITLPHEHIIIDTRFGWVSPSRSDKAGLADLPVSMDMLGLIRHDMRFCKDNLILDDSEASVRELKMFQSIGGRTIVDQTTRGLSPKPDALREIGLKTGLNIVAGSGYYTARTHPPDMGSRTIGSLAEEMIRDIKVGFPECVVKAGVIGEIGTSHPLAENEVKVLRAAAQAQLSTGVAISVHLPSKGKSALQVIDILERAGVDSSRIIVSHMDWMDAKTLRSAFQYHKAVAERGVYLGFDGFGTEDYSEEEDFNNPRDSERLDAIRNLADDGYMDRILISHDISTKAMIRTYGGRGYDHILRTVIPMMKKIGVTDAEINQLMINNPARALAH